MIDRRPDQLPPPPKLPRGKHARKQAEWRAQLSNLNWALDKLAQVEEIILTLKKAKPVSGQALAAMISRSFEARRMAEAALANFVPLEGASDDELREWLGRSLEDWPDEFLEMGFRVYGERHAGRVLFLSKGGHRAEFDPESGWIQTEA